jgi:lipopolysaccharide/colanic/teichoic acid biosynthesis glycosyltransferase
VAPPNDASSAAVVLAPDPNPVTTENEAIAAQAAVSGRIHAVPVEDVVARSGRITEATYRAFEIVVAALGLILTLPIMLLEAALIRVDSSGPVLFFHTRPGLSKQVRGRDLAGRSELIPPPGGYNPDALYYVPTYFKLVKFRTMFRDSLQRFPELYAYKFTPEEFRHKYGTHQGDPRVTRVGEVLRKLSIDELPNLWCVLIGNMRLVGPRPEAPEVLRYYTREEMYKFACKPGITGLAQINGRGLLNFGQVIDWDLRYVRTRSPWRDLKIIFVTLKYVVTRHGAF